jgi:ABC-type glycerol-3-phosphate transport system permease component
VKPTVARLHQAREMLSRKPATIEDDGVGISWANAVAATGKPVGQLVAHFKCIRAAWWSVLAITGSLSVILLIMLMLAYDGLPSSTFRRAGMTLLILGSVAFLSFVKTLIATYRLWQLQQRRVSVEERGTFKDFLAENRWCRQVLTLGHFH